jgi:exodeoxyribonuclease V alpha subunit
MTRNLDRYEREWTAAHRSQQPGPALRRAWDVRAWAEGRPADILLTSGRSGAEVVTLDRD